MMGATEREFERKLAREDMFRRRRRWLLWTPLAAAGAVLIVWQVTLWEPSLPLLLLGLTMCLPWVADC